MKKVFYLFLLFLFLIPLLWNLLRRGFYTSHDGEWMVIRLTAFHDALRQGQFPVRWLPRLNHGYGYPVANFLYPLPFYLAEPIYFLTGNPAAAIQFVMAISIISMALGMFAFLSHRSSSLLHWLASPPNPRLKRQDDQVAIIGSLIYVYSPYIAFNLYQRGSLGEITAMGVVPWVFWAISRDKPMLAALLLTALILSHNVAAVLFLPAVVIYLLIKCFETFNRIPRERTSHSNRLIYPRVNLRSFWCANKNCRHCKLAASVLLLGLGLSAFFWLPALFELRFVRAGQIPISDFQNEYLSLSQTLDRAGIITVLFSGGLPLFFLNKMSSWLWEALKFTQIIQFPWRLLSLFSFISAAAAGYLIKRINHMNRTVLLVGIALSAAAFVSSVKYLRPESFINRPPEYYQTNDDTTTVRAEYTPIWVASLPQIRPETPAIHYYPGWKIFIDGKETPIIDPQSTNGILLPSTPPNTFQNVSYRFAETPLRTFANLLSIGAALVWLRWFSITLGNRSQP